MDIESLKIENEKLKMINGVKSDLISISAHQLRTSLSAQKWILKMFLDKDLGKITTEQEEFIKKASESNERMIDLINNLLNLNHADDTTISFKFEKVNIINLIDQTVFEFSGETQKKEIALIFLKPDKAIPLISCDMSMIRVVLQNLIENAIKYSNRSDKVFIAIKFNERENIVEISVHDNGIGINMEDQSSIFNKFFRAKNATEKDSIGSGLGLFTTQHIVERHKGKISFESAPDTGTTFFVTLPIN